MKIYDYSDKKKLYVCGDIHGEFKKLFHIIKGYLKNNINEDSNDDDDDDNNNEIILPFGSIPINKNRKNNDKYNDSVIIVAGDCGFGFNKFQYYMDLLTKFNTLLSNNNTHVLFMRGNHDDPSYFSEEKINMSNIKTIPDYSIIKLDTYTVLCVGGACSIDRTWRKDNERIINRYSKKEFKQIYWEDEMPIYNEDALKEIIESGIKIDTLVTHTSPDFAYPKNKKNIDYWIVLDKNLDKDLAQERETMSKIYNFLSENGQKINFWCHGHFHLTKFYKLNDISFVSLGCHEIAQPCLMDTSGKRGYLITADDLF